MRTASLVPSRVLTTTEARDELPDIAKHAREEGLDADVVFYGPHRHPDVAIVPAALFEVVAPYLEDIVIAERVRTRLAANAGARGKTLEEMNEILGLDPEEVARAAKEMAVELGGS